MFGVNTRVVVVWYMSDGGDLTLTYSRINVKVGVNIPDFLLTNSFH